MNAYERQVRLLLRVLPLVEYDRPEDGAPFWALKGGTALNFFLGNLPRLSVDIDLAYCPINDRETALREMAASMERLAGRARLVLPGAVVELSPARPVPKVLIRNDGVMVKIEPNATLRGTVFETAYLPLQPDVVRLFEMETRVRCLSAPDLWGGKMCAALDRQHPRDLFDVARLLDTSGITAQIRTAFVVYLVGHGRPMAELLRPNFKPLAGDFANEFEGMAREETSLERLESARARLVEELGARLTEDDKRFLLSVKEGEPDWARLPVPHAARLPAVRWRLENIAKLKREHPAKHARAVRKLRECLGLADR